MPGPVNRGPPRGWRASTDRLTMSMAAVKYLVEELGADVNTVDHEGNTAMHNAAARGDVEMISYLVAKGADPKAVNREVSCQTPNPPGWTIQ